MKLYHLLFFFFLEIVFILLPFVKFLHKSSMPGITDLFLVAIHCSPVVQCIVSADGLAGALQIVGRYGSKISLLLKQREVHPVQPQS